MKFVNPAKDVSVSSMVMRMKLTTSEKISGNRPISNNRKMAGEISQYLKLRSGWAMAAMAEVVAVFRLISCRRGQQAEPLPPEDGRGRGARSHFRIGAGLGGPGYIDSLLLVDADLLRDIVPLSCRRIEDRFWIIARPEL